MQNLEALGLAAVRLPMAELPSAQGPCKGRFFDRDASILRIRRHLTSAWGSRAFVRMTAEGGTRERGKRSDEYL